MGEIDGNGCNRIEMGKKIQSHFFHNFSRYYGRKAYGCSLANPRLLGQGEKGGMHGYTLQSISCFLTLLNHDINIVICLFLFAPFPATNVAESELPTANLLILSLGRPAC